MRAMISVEEALRAVAAAAGSPRVRREAVALPHALGRVLADDVLVDADAPPFDRATMDGYAVRVSDVGPAALPRPLSVVAHVAAGATSSRGIATGEAIAIMTGAPIPPGADLVIPVEWTSDPDAPRGRETRVRIDKTAPPWANIARRAEQVREGDVVLRAGTRLSPAAIGVLAVTGCTTVEVALPPTVEILSTGDEIVPADRRPGPSQIRDSNGFALLAQTIAAGGRGVYRGPVRDDEGALRTAIGGALAADIVLVTGGVSVGEKDLVPGVLEALGVERVFHKWAVKPGGPLWFGRRGETLVFGLPGNPAAAFVGFELLVAPVIDVRLGRPFAPRPMLRAKLAPPLPAPIPRRQYVPVTLDLAVSPVVATRVRSSGSGDPFALARAHGLAVVPAVGESPDASGLVDVIPVLGAGFGNSGAPS